MTYFTYDFDSYLKNRIGFFYELDEAFIGERLLTFDRFLDRLDHALASGVADVPQYQQVRDLFHRHSTASGAAVASRIKALLGSSRQG